MQRINRVLKALFAFPFTWGVLAALLVAEWGFLWWFEPPLPMTLLVVVLGMVLLVGLVLFFLGKPSGDMTPEEAASRLSKLLTEVQWTTEPVQRRAHVQLGQSPELKDTLPEIEQFELVVNPKAKAQFMPVCSINTPYGCRTRHP